MLGRISILFVSLFLYVTYGQVAPPSITPEAHQKVTSSPAQAPACDQKCFDDCNLTEDNVAICGVRCGCENEATELTTELTKNER